MDTMNQVNKVWKDVQASAREYLSLGLQLSAKGLDFAAAQLKTVEESLKKNAEKLAHKDETTAAPTTETK